VTERSRER